MKVPVVFFALQSAGIFSYILSAAAASVSATSPGETRENFALAAVPPPSNVGVVGTSTRLLTDRRLRTAAPYLVPQSRVFPWQASFYNDLPELRYADSYTPSPENGEILLGPYTSKTSEGWSGAENKGSSVLRSAVEKHGLRQFRLPLGTALNGPMLSEGPQLSKFFQMLPDFGSLNNLVPEPLLYNLRTLRQKKDEGAEAVEKEVRQVQVERQEEGDDEEVEKKKKKKKKMHGSPEEREGPWEEDESEGDHGAAVKVPGEKKHDMNTGERKESRQYEEGGREGKHKIDEGGAGEERAGGQESERRAYDAREGKKSRKGVQEAFPPAVVQDERDEKASHASPRSFDGDISHVPGQSNEDTSTAEEKQRRQTGQPKVACAGVCQVHLKTERWEDADVGKKSEKEEVQISPSEEAISAPKPKAGKSFKKDDAKGEEGPHIKDVGDQEEAGSRGKRSPESFHPQRMEKENLLDRSERVRKMMFGPRRYIYYQTLPEYTYVVAPRTYWRPGFYYAPPDSDEDDYYPVFYYRRWLRGDTSESDKDKRAAPLHTGEVLGDRVKRKRGVDCVPGSSCSITPQSYHLTQSSDDVRVLENVYHTADASHMVTSNEYTHARH